MSLEVCRGRTHFPRRPVESGRFLIGSADRCDLRLGGEGIPALHSIIHIDGDEVRIDAVAWSPALKLNGRAERSALIDDGDIVEIGPFQFIVHKQAEGGPGGSIRERPDGLEHLLDPVPEDLADFDDDLDLSELSAAELVELIENEEAGIEEFETRRRSGAAALIDAAKRMSSTDDRRTLPGTQSAIRNPQSAIRNPQSPAPVDAREGELLSEIERVVAELNRFSQELERRSQRLSEREASYAESTAVLLDVQHKLTTQLESLVDQIHVLHEKTDRPDRPLRAIA